MNRQTITVDIAPGAGPVQRLKVSQGDIGRPLGVYIIQNGEALSCSGYSVDLYVLKPDGNYYVASATVATTPTNLVTWETATQETPVAGECKSQIRIRQGDDDIGTANFVEYVEPTPGYLGSASESQIALIEELVEEAQDSADRAEEATTKNPRVSSTTDNWEVWNATTEEWVDTGVPATGPQGPEGERGPTGYGVPAGGTTGQVMRKASGTDYDFSWETLNGTDIPMSSTDATSVNAALAKLDSNINQTNDVLASAVSATATTLFRGSGGSYTGTLPNANYKYSTFMVNVRGSDKMVIAHCLTTNNIAINTYNDGAWTGWKELAIESELLYSDNEDSINVTIAANSVGLLVNRVLIGAAPAGKTIKAITDVYCPGVAGYVCPAIGDNGTNLIIRGLNINTSSVTVTKIKYRIWYK